jgi:hypothetical protein
MFVLGGNRQEPEEFVLFRNSVKFKVQNWVMLNNSDSFRCSSGSFYHSPILLWRWQFQNAHEFKTKKLRTEQDSGWRSTEHRKCTNVPTSNRNTDNEWIQQSFFRNYVSACFIKHVYHNMFRLKSKPSSSVIVYRILNVSNSLRILTDPLNLCQHFGDCYSRWSYSTYIMTNVRINIKCRLDKSKNVKL